MHPDSDSERRLYRTFLECYRDMTKLIEPINSRFISLCEGNGMETSLMSDEERRFMWNLAFFFTISYRGVAFKAFYAIRSFITFHGIFMGPGYDLGDESIWRRNPWRQIREDKA